MRKVVAVRGPQPPKAVVKPSLSPAAPAPTAVAIEPDELKVVTLSKGKVVKREAWDGKNHLR
jgi:hypothetical protein